VRQVFEQLTFAIGTDGQPIDFANRHTTDYAHYARNRSVGPSETCGVSRLGL